MKIKLKWPVIIAIFVYHSIFINLNYISSYSIFKYLGIIIASSFFLLRFKIFIKKKYFKLNCIMMLFVLSIIITTLYNNKFYIERSFLVGIFHALSIMNVYLFFQYLNYTKKFNVGIDIFYKLTLIYIIINDFVMFMFPSMFTRYGNYFVGNKFNVTYLHILYFILYYQRNIRLIKYNNIKGIILLFNLIFVFVISIFTTCTTGVMACFIIIVFMISTKGFKKVFLSNKMMIGVLLISDTILLVGSSILSNGFIQYLIVDILNEDITLTGRMRIYGNITNIIKERIWSGYGYGNSYYVLMDKINAANSQNGILEVVINYGVIGTVLMIYLMYESMRNVTNEYYKYPIVMLIYVYIILSAIEITLSSTLVALFAMISCYDNLLNKVEGKVG